MAQNNKFKFKEATDIVDFGTFKGSTILDLIEKETGYVQWCIENVKHFKLNKKLQLILDNKVGITEEN